MIDKLLGSRLNDVIEGCVFHTEQNVYECLICGERFEVGEIFNYEGRLYEAFKVVKVHIQTVHGGVLSHLLDSDKKYTGLTEKQNNLLREIADGLTDKEISLKNGVATATVRHQRFMFREKAKQAKLYLAIYESVEQASMTDKKDQLIKAHVGATMVDERYIMTVDEDEKIIKNYFETLEPLILKILPSKEKKKIAVLRKITAQFDPTKLYTEKALNETLKTIYEDVATIRRYLIQYGFFERTTDCSQYWIKK